MVDDHKMTLVGYSSVLEEAEGKYRFSIRHATTMEDAMNALEKVYNTRTLHLLLLDIHLPKEGSEVYQSGEGLGKEIRKRFPECRIIIITTFSNNMLIHNLMETINPEGFLIKVDVTPQILLKAVTEVLEDPPFYSKRVTKALRRHTVMYHTLDYTDRLILYYISEGKMTKDLPDYVHLSLAAIEKRKKRLKEIFNVEHGNDMDLMGKAREAGFL